MDGFGIVWYDHLQMRSNSCRQGARRSPSTSKRFGLDTNQKTQPFPDPDSILKDSRLGSWPISSGAAQKAFGTHPSPTFTEKEVEVARSPSPTPPSTSSEGIWTLLAPIPNTFSEGTTGGQTGREATYHHQRSTGPAQLHGTGLDERQVWTQSSSCHRKWDIVPYIDKRCYPVTAHFLVYKQVDSRSGSAWSLWAVSTAHRARPGPVRLFGSRGVTNGTAMDCLHGRHIMAVPWSVYHLGGLAIGGGECRPY